MDHLGGVQERLARDAAAVEADAPEPCPFVHEGDSEAAVGGVEGGRVAAGAPADDEQLRFANVGHASTPRVDLPTGVIDEVAEIGIFRRRDRKSVV